MQHHGNAGLLAAALDDAAHGFGEVAVLRFGAEMVEQFAHVFIAILDAVADHLDVVAHGFVIRQQFVFAEHLKAHIDERQRLRQAVVQAAGDAAALFEHGVLLFEQGHGGVFAGDAQLGAQQAHQTGVLRGKQRHGRLRQRQPALKTAQGINGHQRHQIARFALHPHHIAGFAFLFGSVGVRQAFGQTLRQADGAGGGKAFFRLPENAAAPAVGKAQHPLQKGLFHFAAEALLVQVGGNVIQHFPLAFLAREGRSFLGDFVFQVGIHFLQVVGHAVEAVGHGFEFVAGIRAGNTRTQAAVGDLVHGLIQRAERAQHHLPQQAEADSGRKQDQQHQPDAPAAQPADAAGVLLFQQSGIGVDTSVQAFGLLQ